MKTTIDNTTPYYEETCYWRDKAVKINYQLCKFSLRFCFVMFCLLLAKSLIAAFWAMNFPRALNLLHASCLQGFGTKFWKLQQYVQHAFNFLTEIVCSMTVASFLIFHVDGTCRVLQQKNSLRVFSNIIKPGHFTVASGLELEIALWLELAAYIDVVWCWISSCHFGRFPF